MKELLGKLEKIDPRQHWNNEARDFTPWLAREESIVLLGEVIGMELEVVSQEEKVGSFSADILCKDISKDQYVVIENQLEKTDHIHLGQLITYCSGLEASSFIWIAKQFTEEHRAAIDWLNNITDDHHNFFGIEIELYKIGNSPLAPKFTVVSQPNNWAKTVRSQANNAPLSDTKRLQVEYWTAFKGYIEKQKGSSLRPQKPLPQHWTNISIGSSAINISPSVDSKTKTIKVWLNINGYNPKGNYDKLHQQLFEKSLIVIGEDVRWDRLDDKKMSLVELKKSADFTNRYDWDNQFEWLYDTIEKFTTLFKPVVQGLK